MHCAGGGAVDPELDPPPAMTNVRPARSAVVNGPTFHFRNFRYPFFVFLLESLEDDGSL